MSATTIFQDALRSVVKEACQDSLVPISQMIMSTVVSGTEDKLKKIDQRVSVSESNTKDAFEKMDRRISGILANVNEALQKIRSIVNEKCGANKLSVERVENNVEELLEMHKKHLDETHALQATVINLSTKVYELSPHQAVINSLTVAVSGLSEKIASLEASHQSKENTSQVSRINELEAKIVSLEKALPTSTSSLSPEVRTQFVEEIVQVVGVVRDTKIDAFNEILTAYNKDLVFFRTHVDEMVRKSIKQQEEATSLKIQQVKLDMEKKAMDYLVERSNVLSELRSEWEAYINMSVNDKISFLRSRTPVSSHPLPAPSLLVLILDNNSIQEDEKMALSVMDPIILNQVDVKLHEFQSNIRTLLNEWSGAEHKWANDLISNAIEERQRQSTPFTRKRKGSPVKDVVKVLEAEEWPSYLRPRNTLPPSVLAKTLSEQLAYAKKHRGICQSSAIARVNKKKQKTQSTEEQQEVDGDETEDEDEGEAEYTAPTPSTEVDLRCDEFLPLV